MKRQLIGDIEKLAQQALASEEPHVAYILGILCGSLARGDEKELSDAVGNWVKLAIWTQTLKQLEYNAAFPDGSNCIIENN
jgi:hypothetical protein